MLEEGTLLSDLSRMNDLLRSCMETSEDIQFFFDEPRMEDRQITNCSSINEMTEYSSSTDEKLGLNCSSGMNLTQSEQNTSSESNVDQFRKSTTFSGFNQFEDEKEIEQTASINFKTLHESREECFKKPLKSILKLSKDGTNSKSFFSDKESQNY